jgi:hypothetical protein
VTKVRILAGIVAIVLLGSARADSLTIDQIIYQSGSGQDTSLMSGTLEVTLAGNVLTVTMTNTSADGAFTDATAPASMLLTGFGIQLPGSITISSGSVAPASGSSNVNFDAGQSATDISNQYVYANSSIDGYNLPGVFTVDTVVSSVANGGATRFAGPPPVSIDGPDYGALSSLETQYGNSTPAVNDSIVFTLTLSEDPANDAAFLAALEAGNVVLAFGSPTAVVPEPSTLLLAGSALTWLGATVRRRYRKPQN